MLKIYHNPRCSKSRAGMQFIVDHNLDHTVVEYLKSKLSASEIKELVEKTGLDVMDLVRTHEAFFKSELKGKTFTDDEWYQILADNPNLLHRPIVVKGDKAVFAQPPENIKGLL